MDIFVWCLIGFGGFFIIGIISSPGMMRNKGSIYEKIKKKEKKRRQKSTDKKRSGQTLGFDIGCKPKEKDCQRHGEGEHKNEKKPPTRSEEEIVGQ